MFLLKKSIKFFGILSVVVLLSGCDYNNNQANVEAAALIAKQSAVKTEASAWLTYWDLQGGTADLKRISSNLKALVFFAAYFDKDQKLFIPKELQAERSSIKKRDDCIEYLSIVNDKVNADGTTSVKNIEMLKTVLKTNNSMDKHISEIIELTQDGDFGGVEIDYERVWKDAETQELFLKFIAKLYCATEEQGLKLRIVLEPSTPFCEVQFISGPEYVVMMYNLYGTHTLLPGPKADKEFIQNTLDKMDALPEPRAVAYATGGCSWNSKGQRKLITEKEALEIAKKRKILPVRDGNSQCLILRYRDGITFYSVWFADAHTINYWSSLAKEGGITRISLWRLGGNVGIEQIRI